MPHLHRRSLLLTLALAGGLGALGGAGLACRSDSSANRPAAARPRPADRTDLPALPTMVLQMAGGRLDPIPPKAGETWGILIEPGKPLEVVVRPIHKIDQRFFPRLFWWKGEEVRRWRVPLPMLGLASTYRWREQGPAVPPLGSGSGLLTAVISSADDIPEEVEAAWLRQPPAHWQVRTYPVRWP